MKFISLFLFLLIFQGCDGELYRTLHDKRSIGISLKSVEVVANDSFSKQSVESVLKRRGFLVEKSPYRVRAEHRDYKKACTNPLSKTSSDYSFDGLVAIEFFNKDVKVYSAYMDYKGEAKEALFAKLIDAMIKDLQIRE